MLLFNDFSLPRSAMYKKTSVFIEIFQLYEVGKYDPAYNKIISNHNNVEQELQTMRKAIRAKLRESFPQYDWSDTNNWLKLSRYEREYFKYVTIYDYMETHLGTTFKKVKSKIEQYKKTDLEVLEENDYYENLEKQFFNPTDSEELQLRAYKKLCSILSRFYYIFPPSFDEWRADPKTPLEYVQSVDIDVNEINDTDLELKPEDSEIDHYLLHTLLKLLKNEYGIEINIERIKKDLKNRKEEEMERISAKELSAEFPYIKPFKITDKENIKYLRSRIRRNRLDYIEKKGNIVKEENEGFT